LVAPPNRLSFWISSLLRSVTRPDQAFFSLMMIFLIASTVDAHAEVLAHVVFGDLDLLPAFTHGGAPASSATTRSAWASPVARKSSALMPSFRNARKSRPCSSNQRLAPLGQ
jgi:hypothetical protein